MDTLRRQPSARIASRLRRERRLPFMIPIPASRYSLPPAGGLCLNFCWRARCTGGLHSEIQRLCGITYEFSPTVKRSVWTALTWATTYRIDRALGIVSTWCLWLAILIRRPEARRCKKRRLRSQRSNQICLCCKTICSGNVNTIVLQRQLHAADMRKSAPRRNQKQIRLYNNIAFK